MYNKLKFVVPAQMLEIFSSITELNRHAAERLIDIGNEAIASRGRFDLVLSGGSTPRGLYQLLSEDSFKSRLDWPRVYFFFGDERNVPSDHEESNFRMANETLFQPLAISPDQIIRWHTELDSPEIVAQDYAEQIDHHFENGPLFDLILLGLGADGHTASLFPDTEAVNEKSKTAVANWIPQLDSYRLTLTFPVINSARNIVFLVAGRDKAAALKRVLHGKHEPDSFPSQFVNPTGGKLFWIVDAAAATLLRDS